MRVVQDTAAVVRTGPLFAIGSKIHKRHQPPMSNQFALNIGLRRLRGGVKARQTNRDKYEKSQRAAHSRQILWFGGGPVKGSVSMGLLKEPHAALLVFNGGILHRLRL